jgi:RHS repeat-associated protein
MFKHLWFAAVIGLLGQISLLGQGTVEPVKVPVKVQLSGGKIDTPQSYAMVMLADQTMEAYGQAGKVQSTVNTFSLEVGKTYAITVSSAFGGHANNLKVVGPPGYTVMLGGTRRTAMTISSDTVVNVRVLPPDDQMIAPAGTATAFAVGQVKWAVSLGSLRGGTASAGWLRLVGTGISDDWTSFINAASLYYEDNADSVTVYKDKTGVIRQIATPEAFVDVICEVDANKVPTALTMDFYQPDSAVTVGKAVFKSFIGKPFVSYRITKSESSIPWRRQLTITRQRREISTPADMLAPVSHIDRTTLQLTATSLAAADYRWVTTPWTIDRGTPRSCIVSQWSPIANNGGHNETLIIGTPLAGTPVDGNLANLKIEAQSTNVHGRITTTSADLLAQTVSENAKDTFTYYNDASVASSYGFPRSKQSAAGNWVFYAYKSITTNDGDDSKLGTISATYTPFVSTPAAPPSVVPNLDGNSIPASGVYTTYDYAEDAFKMLTRLKTAKTYINGVLTSSTQINYTTAVANTATYVIATRTDQADQSGSVLTSVSKYYQENVGDDLYRGQPYAQVRPDGSKLSYIRLHGWWNPVDKTFTKDAASAASLVGVISGSEQSVSGGTAQTSYEGHAIDKIWVVSGRSTLELVIRDERNRIVRTESQVWDGSKWQSVNWVNFGYDWSNRLVSKLSSNGDTYEARYSAGVKNYEIDGSGIKVSYLYDDGDRIKAVTKEGLGTLPDITTEFTYDSLDRIIQEDTYAIGHAAEKITTKRTYDLAGRLVSESVPAAAALGTAIANNGLPANARTATTGYTYQFGSSGGSIVTVTLPDASTRIRTSYLDGQLYSLTGTGLVPKFFTYGVLSNGKRTTQVKEVPISRLASTSSPDLTDLPRYTKVTTDWLGRVVQTERPGFTGLPAFIERNTYSPDTGFLIKADKGIAPFLYEYDALGQLIRSGLDLNRNGVLDLAGPDRISGQESKLLYENNAWWFVANSFTYASTSSAMPVTTGSVRERLSGFTGKLRSETRSTDAEGNITIQTVTVDRAAKLVQSKTSIPGVSLPEIDDVANGLPTQKRTADGLTVKLSYDYLQRPLKVTDSRSNNITTAYYPGTTLPYSHTAAWDAPVVIATYGYDLMGRMVWTRNADDYYTRTAYNERGQVKQQWGNATYPTSFDYTDYGELKSLYTYQTDSGFTGETWPTATNAASTTQWDYDGPSGLLAKKINKTADHADPFVRYEYNALGQVLNRYWARTLDGTANTDHVKAVYSYDDDTAELLGITYNDGTPSVETTYNRIGQPVTVTDATVENAASVRTFLWDGDSPWRLNGERLPDFYQNRLLGRLYENGTDAASGKVKGRLCGFQLGTLLNPAAYLEQTLRVDGAGRVAGLSSARDNSTVNQAFSYAYAANSRLLESISANGTGFKLKRQYEAKRDLLGKIVGTWTAGSMATTISEHDYQSGNLGQRFNVSQSGTAFADYGEVTSQNFAYTPRGELQSAGAYMGQVMTMPNRALPGRQFEFGYDEIGNRLSVNHTGQPADTEIVVPNELNQIHTRENKSISVSGTAAADATVAVGTDVASREGNFWQKDVALNNSAGPVAKQVDVVAAKPGAAENGADLVQIDRRYLLIGRAVETMTYDADGNLKSDDHWLYKWDAENRLVEMKANPWTATAHGPDRLKLEFQYDYLDRRVAKKVSKWATTTAGSDWVVQSVRKFVYDGWNLIAETDADGHLLRSYTWGLSPGGALSPISAAGALVQITDHSTGQSYFPTYDGNGNVVALTRAIDGALAASYEYDPFGESLRQSGFYAAENPIRFSGKYTDTESGLVYYGYRYYEPRNGRFINRDPIEESGGLNLYGFVGNDPVNREDLLGMLEVSFSSSSSSYTLSNADVYGGRSSSSNFSFSVGGSTLNSWMASELAFKSSTGSTTSFQSSPSAPAKKASGGTAASKSPAINSAMPMSNGHASDRWSYMGDGIWATGPIYPYSNPYAGEIRAYKTPTIGEALRGFSRGAWRQIGGFISVVAHPIDTYRHAQMISEPLTPYGNKVDHFLLTQKLRMNSPYGWGQTAGDIGVGAATWRIGSVVAGTVRGFQAGLATENVGSQTFYRVMSGAEANAVNDAGGIALRTGESFVTQDLAYVQQLAARHPQLYSNLATFEMQEGTREALLSIGARNNAQVLIDAGLGDLPVIQRGMTNVVHVKGELEFINFGLRSGSVDAFNSRIINFTITPLK